ncbi:chloride channel [Leucosporidium creatinivorum]|uniref:Chloride channel n=1 Tax=Leucosporidium creatinivorum TaxID=106004 RepID=A0A1Y2E2Q1_9BASI|nr:chloride channel [Leucosporidium creatinivorum]
MASVGHSRQASLAASTSSAPVHNTPERPRTRQPPSTPDTPTGLHRYLPRILFPFDRAGTGDEWLAQTARVREAYLDASTIDWSYEESRERIRVHELAELKGLRGVSERLWDSAIPWLVVVATGIGTGAVASCLDILSAWLSDLRMGVCRDRWWMSKGVCCMGLDRGEVCNAWKVWGEGAGNSGHFILRSMTQYSVYMILAVLFAVTSSFFVQTYAPFAFHTGIPEIKTILGGYIISGFLAPMVLLVKSLGLPLAVASGLSLGKEGPLVHVACCIGNLLLRPFAVLRGNEARQREILSAAAAAGVSVAFGAPLGGVLFSLEEISTFFPGSTLWQSFVCAVVAAITLQYVDPFNTGKLVLFQVTTSQIWRGFELIPWLFLGVCGGLWGAWFIRLNEEWERMRRGSGLNQWPVTEVAALSLFTAVVSYLVIFMRIPSSELVANLFQDCSAVDSYGLCDTSNSFTIVTFLLVTAFAKTLLTAVTFGAYLPAGIFLPSLTIGACVGRAVGIIMSNIQRAHPEAWLFANCPADGACISPPVYAVIGAASALGGVTRMTISLVVILFELTGAIDLVLQIMMAVMVSKFTGDFFSKNGIYETWINIRNYPFLNNKVDYRRDTIVARDVMTKVKNIVYLSDEGWTFDRLEALLDTEEYRGFPIVQTLANRVVIGYIARLELQVALDRIRVSPDVTPTTPCYFSINPARGPQVGPNAPPLSAQPASGRERASEKKKGLGIGLEEPHVEEQGSWVSLKDWVDEIPITMSQETPMEVVVQMFQRLGLRSVLFTRQGALTGILTKMDLHAHIHPKPETIIRRLRPGARATAPTPSSSTLRARDPESRRPSTLEHGVGEDIGLMDDVSVASSRNAQGHWV